MRERCQEVDAPTCVRDPTPRSHSASQVFAESPHSEKAQGSAQAARVPGFVDVGCVPLRTAGSWTSLEDR